MAAGGVDLPDDALASVAASVGAGHPLGRPITAEDCAEAALYLVSDRSANVTGILLPVDGGYVAR
jgi:enoyl-[acyl-carrier-protein] reductase (NADH)